MIFPLGDDNPSRSTPYVTYGLVALNVLVFGMVNLAMGDIAAGRVFVEWGFQPRNPVSLGLISSMFLHGGFAHIVGNLWILWIFGDNVEDKLGHGRFLVTYLFGGVAACWTYAALAHATADPVGPTLALSAGELPLLDPLATPLVGASGAIATVMGAYLIFFPEARIRLLMFFFVIFQFMRIRAKWFIGLTLGLDLLRTISAGGPAYGSVATSAHVGGGIFGVLVAAWMKPRIGGGGAGDAWDVHTGFASQEVSTGGSQRFGDPYGGRLRPPPTSEPDLMNIERTLVHMVREGRTDEAIALYPAYEAQPREQPLPGDVQIELAHAFYRMGLPRDALKAYLRYLDTHPRGGDAPEAKFRVGTLYSRAFGEPRRAVPWLTEAAAEHKDAQIAAFAREELKRAGG